jgi:hypothetical protein
VAGFGAILRALARAVWRDLRSFHTIQGNNFFLFVLLLMQQLASALFFVLILGFLLLFPLAADPLRKIPPERLAMWPLSRLQRTALRVASIALSPVAWITAVLLCTLTSPATGLRFLALAVAIQAVAAASSRMRDAAPQFTLRRLVPKFPGTLGGLIRKDLRQSLAVLDPWLALLLTLCGTGYRMFAIATDAEAFTVLALVIALTLSTYAQCLFGLDLGEGMERYRMLPLRGRQVLLAKDAAYLLLLFVLVAPLDPLAGMTAGLTALAVGHHASVMTPAPQTRRRFTGGALFPTGFVQALCMTSAGVAAHRESAWYFGASVVAWSGSLWYYGRAWERGMAANEGE